MFIIHLFSSSFDKIIEKYTYIRGVTGGVLSVCLGVGVYKGCSWHRKDLLQ